MNCLKLGNLKTNSNGLDCWRTQIADLKICVGLIMIRIVYQKDSLPYLLLKLHHPIIYHRGENKLLCIRGSCIIEEIVFSVSSTIFSGHVQSPFIVVVLPVVLRFFQMSVYSRFINYFQIIKC